jgi:misacylated tRNA(Ala) deacylase
VVHRLGRPEGAHRLAIGEEVEGTVDWPRRFLNMRLHTAQHLVSARIFTTLGLRTRRAAMAGHGGTIDLEGTWPETAPIDSLATDVREHIARGVPINVLHLPRAEWNALPTDRSGVDRLPAHIDPVRVVEIAGIDRCPCGGTHLKTTSEIGPIEVHAPVPVPGGSRVPFTLGETSPPIPNG